jgi:hypothetical protein
MSTLQELRDTLVEAAVHFRRAETVRDDAHDLYVRADRVCHSAHLTLRRAVAALDALEAHIRKQAPRGLKK